MPLFPNLRVERIAQTEGGDFLAGFCNQIGIVDVVEHTGDPLSHLFTLFFLHAAGGDGRGSQAQTRGLKR